MPCCTGISPTSRSAVCSVMANSILPVIFMLCSLLFAPTNPR
jgi:hypothetical protein